MSLFWIIVIVLLLIGGSSDESQPSNSWDNYSQEDDTYGDSDEIEPDFNPDNVFEDK